MLHEGERGGRRELCEPELSRARDAALQHFVSIGVARVGDVMQPRERERHARVVSPCLCDAYGLVDCGCGEIQMPKAEVECREVEDGVLDDAARVASGC